MRLVMATQPLPNFLAASETTKSSSLVRVPSSVIMRAMKCSPSRFMI